MRVLFVCMILAAVTLIGGCGSATTTAGASGVFGGFAVSETLKGVQADLERREQAMIERYNELVQIGAKTETLDELREQIRDTVRLRHTTEVADSAMSTKWSDPAAAGGAIAAIIATGYAWLKRKDLNNTVAGIRAFRAAADEGTKHQLDKSLLDKKAAT